MISTDKAVRPTGIMGASKRLAELVIQNLQLHSKNCVFGIVRFGNVLGSSGSVIPLFREQIENGGPVTLTHSNVTRFFMTIDEAAYLVLLAGSFAENGEVFVLDMGEPVRIEDLARRMIALFGKTARDQENPDGDIEIQLTGLRDGEKLYEELLIGDSTLPTPHHKILRAQEKIVRSRGFVEAIETLRSAVNENDTKCVQEIMLQFVEDYGAEMAEQVRRPTNHPVGQRP
jgi:FlaA1/EpsC-like NDP-sugar epimerase